MLRNCPVIQCFEHDRLMVDDDGLFTRAHWRAIGEYNEKYKDRFLTLLPNGVKFSEYVGVIQVGNLTIEVLPKIDRMGGEKADWQAVLLDMLRECRWMQVFAHEKAALRHKPNSILEAYVELYLQACEAILHEGLVKKYRQESSNLHVWKGKLNFTRQIRHNLVHQERFFTDHTIYDRENRFNQLLYKALNIIPNLTTNTGIRDKLSRLLLDFPEMQDIPVTAETFQQLVFDRKTTRYREALEMAAMLLLNYRPDIRNGRHQVLAILFDMNELWEEFCFRRLRAVMEPGWGISRQNRVVFWQSESNQKWIKPDIVVKTPDGKTVIIDTKWKTPDGFVPSDDDLKQIFVYNKHWSSNKGVLLYPLNESGDPFQKKAGTYKIPGSTEQCECIVAKVDILTGGTVKRRLNMDFGRFVIEGLEGDSSDSPQIQQAKRLMEGFSNV